MSTNNKIALVTGGSRGLGKDMAISLAKKGINVVLTYRTQKEEAESVVATIEGLGQKAAALQLDTAVIKSFDDFYKQLFLLLKEKFATEHFDFLINNAGVGLRTPIAEVTEAQFDDLMNIHFKGVLFLTQKALPFLNDGGRIINISTGLTRFSYPGSGIYASMKGAMEVISRYMAAEFGARGIAVNVVAPGAIATDFGGGTLKNNTDMQDHIKGITALGRIAHPDDIGGVVAFLCTEDAKWVNAQRIEVSGGFHI